jgi:hypothetical protein
VQITVNIDDSKVADLVRERIGELFSADSRYRETSVRDHVRRLVDDAAVAAVRAASAEIAGQLPEMARQAVERQVREDIQAAAKRGLQALRKLYAGFDPAKLTDQQRTWLVDQISGAAAGGM